MGKLLTLPANIRLGLKWMAVVNTLTYHDMAEKVIQNRPQVKLKKAVFEKSSEREGCDVTGLAAATLPTPSSTGTGLTDLHMRSEATLRQGDISIWRHLKRY